MSDRDHDHDAHSDSDSIANSDSDADSSASASASANANASANATTTTTTTSYAPLGHSDAASRALSAPPPPRCVDPPKQPHDAVFSNLLVKSSTNVAAPTPVAAPSSVPPAPPAAPELPPSYDTAMNIDPPPPEYIDNTFFASPEVAASLAAAGAAAGAASGPFGFVVSPDADVIIEGLAVGSAFTFFVTLLLTFTFQFVGFIFSYLLSMSHAGRNGAKAGLGLLIMQMGMFLHGRVSDARYAAAADAGENGASTSVDRGVLASSELASYALLVCGWLVLLKSTADFMRVKRLEAVILANPDSFNA